MAKSTAIPRVLALALLAGLGTHAAWAQPAAPGPEPLDVREALVEEGQSPLDGVWIGEFRQFDPGRFMGYPMRMEVLTSTGPDGEVRIEGTLHWPTLRDSVTVLAGTRHANMLRLTETELLQGSNIVLDGHYLASFRTPDRIEGIWVHPEGLAREGFGSFVLERTSLPRLVPVAGPSWIGGRDR